MSKTTGPSDPDPIVQVESNGPGLIVRFLWFLVVGWWLSQIAIIAAWVFNALIITLPIGLYILNRIPQVATLRPSSVRWESTTEGGVNVLRQRGVVQRGFLQRTIYFVLIGWWFSLVWLEIAWFAQWTIILIPLSFWMYSKSAAVTTLRRT